MNNALKKQIYPKKSRYIYLDLLHNTVVSRSPRLMSPLSNDMKNEQICKTTYLGIQYHCTFLRNFESELEWRIQKINAFGVEILVNQVSS